MEASEPTIDPSATIKLAPGLHAVTRDGITHIEPSGERRDKTIAFRLTASEYLELQPFIDSFPQRQSGIAIRWLLENEDVRKIMAARITNQTRKRRR